MGIAKIEKIKKLLALAGSPNKKEAREAINKAVDMAYLNSINITNEIDFLLNQSKCTKVDRPVMSNLVLLGKDLRGADLYMADLTGANLTGANLTGANLTGAKF